jgi:ribonuclease G
VQVIKDPIGTKGARLSTQISIAGRMLVYLPQDKHIGISQRIENEAERERLRSKVQALLPAEEKGGFIIRTMAEDASDADLQMDVEYLRKTWATIIKQAKTKPAPTLLHQDLSLAQRVLRDFVSDQTATIQVDSRENFQMLRRIYTPSVLPKLMHYRASALFDLYGVEEEIERALGRRVDLKSGGYLIVDQTEAMTTIDVNTGGFVGGATSTTPSSRPTWKRRTPLRQLRLRNLGGIIILDFIDMESGAPPRRAGRAEQGAARDRTKISVSGFSTLGLVEMTRKRTRESLAHILCETCPACKGWPGQDRARCATRSCARSCARPSSSTPRIPHPGLAGGGGHVPGRGIAAPGHAGDFIGKPVSLQVQSDYQQEQYDIILM